jgi:hypothetical protein
VYQDKVDFVDCVDANFQGYNLQSEQSKGDENEEGVWDRCQISGSHRDEVTYFSKIDYFNRRNTKEWDALELWSF